MLIMIDRQHISMFRHHQEPTHAYSNQCVAIELSPGRHLVHRGDRSSGTEHGNYPFLLGIWGIALQDHPLHKHSDTVYIHIYHGNTGYR